MLFNSLQFLLFFALVTSAYYLLPQKARWGMLLMASCIFYMAFIPKYILILLLTITVDYFAAIGMEKVSGPARRWLLIVSILSTCLILFFFKYFNFFNANIDQLARAFNWNYPLSTLKVILPIGLSFHTFQSLSYVIEVYFGRQKAERHFGIYSLYVMFYPQLVAGPIERPQNLLHQFREPHAFDYAGVTDGLKLMVWGLFKKVVIADRLSILVNQVYGQPHAHSGIALLLATLFFTVQIYCDFSGYSDIALGSAQVMGFKLMKNFRQPYWSRSIPEFWRRWHISLSTWFKDYLYIPLGGNRVPEPRRYLNLLITFMVSGLWHGANWTFIVWGALHAFYQVGGQLTLPWRARLAAATRIDRLPFLQAILQTAATLCLVGYAWIFFRAATLSDALYISGKIFGLAGELAHPQALKAGLTGLMLAKNHYIYALAGVAVLETAHLLQHRGSVRAMISARPWPVRWLLYFSAVLFIALFGTYHNNAEFIYFQF